MKIVKETVQDQEMNRSGGRPSGCSPILWCDISHRIRAEAQNSLRAVLNLLWRHVWELRKYY